MILILLRRAYKKTKCWISKLQFQYVQNLKSRSPGNYFREKHFFNWHSERAGVFVPLIQRDFLVVLLFLIVQLPVSGQNRKYYENLKKEKKASIEYSKELLSSLKNTNEDILNRLLITKNQISKQKEILNLINKELILIDEEILTDERKAESLAEESVRIKEEYARLLQFTWLNMDRQKKMIFILSADNFNKAYKRMLYLKHLSDYRKSRSLKISEIKLKTDSAIGLLKHKKRSKELLKMEMSVLIDSLELKRKDLNSLILTNRGQIEKLGRTLDKDNRQKEITNSRLEKQISTIEENKQTNDSKIVTKLVENTGSYFEKSRRKHIWPLSKFVVLHRFGDYSHPVMSNIRVKNDGLELGTSSFANVHCIFEGSVVNILDIPGDGNSIIIKHGEYYSVYSKVDKVAVKPGDIVQKGQVIARLGGGDKVVKLNFQLWKGKTKLDPELWLKKQ